MIYDPLLGLKPVECINFCTELVLNYGAMYTNSSDSWQRYLMKIESTPRVFDVSV